MADLTTSPPPHKLRWFQGVPRYAWLVLFICALGWLFDTMDQHLFTLVRQDSVTELLKGRVPAADLDGTVKQVGGWITAVFLLGWAAGGFLFGMVGDRLGRARTMMLTILTYAVFTGLNALVREPWQYATCRFLTAMGVGGEFAAGASLVAEVWPERSRPMALGTLQALSAFGNMSAAVITYILASLSWRWVFVVGALPALLVVWIQASVKEPEKWQKAKEEAKKAKETDGAKKQVGSIAALFQDPVLRRNTIAGILLATAGVGGVWGVAFFLPDLVGSALKPIVAGYPDIAALTGPAKADAIKTAIKHYRSIVFFIQQVGAFLGMLGYAALSERIGRKPAMLLVFILAFFSVQAAFWGLRDPLSACLLAFPLGFCALAPFAAYAVYFPELYPTRLRATGVGFCYNAARIVAAAAPFALGGLARMFASPTDETAGLRTAASIIAFIYVAGLIGLIFAPETKGRPLPE
jgi:MFS family permease